jgi:uncharacterized membrane protein YgaE (UPF0421/DUF939 family)
VKKLFRPFNFFDIDRAIHSIKTVIACLLGFLVAHLLQLNNEQWTIITILVVMCAQPRVGALLQKSYMRFLGTLIGGVIAGCTLTIFGADKIAIITVLCLAALWFSYIAESPSILSDAGTIGVVTVAIILLSPQQSISYAADRFLEINIGIVIALLVSRFLWPLHSRTRLLHAIAITISQLKDFYALLTQIEFFKMDVVDIAYEEKIIGGLIKQRKLFEEAIREAFSPIPLVSEFKIILYCEREILRNISLMYTSLHEVGVETAITLNRCNALHELHEQIMGLLNCLIQALNKQQAFEQFQAISLPANWKKQIKDSVNIIAVDTLEEELLQINSFIFCAERLIDRLLELAGEINKLFVK